MQMGEVEPKPTRRVGEEASKTIERKSEDGFVARYLSGSAILDIGYRGYIDNVEPIVPQAIGIELDYPDYDGQTLPFGDFTQDAVFSSHCLEHIADYKTAIRDWHRVLKIGGYMIVAVPHQFLYEKRAHLPSRYNEDHKRFYTPASLLAEVEASLQPNTYRVRHLIDNDLDFDYSIPPSRHSGGCYEIELVLERIAPPFWRLEEPPPAVSDQVTQYQPPPPPEAPESRFVPRWYQAAVLKAWVSLPNSVRNSVPKAVRSGGGTILWRSRRP